jgi:CheY-like chemotaxis protein
MYAEELERAGYAVSEAHNGLQAVEKATELEPDAIVTDLGLPGIDGYELCRRLHRNPRLGSIPIVAITGRYFSDADIARARREGCQAVLIKPFVGDDLVAEVRKVLSSSAR